MGTLRADPGVISDLDAYLDAAPRADADPVETGAFTLFVSRTPWNYYARPTLIHPKPIVATDLDQLATVCVEHGVALEIEWVSEVHPELADLAAGHGLQLATHALMIADRFAPTAPAPDGATIRVVNADDPALLSGRAVADVSFAVGGTAPGPGSSAERDAAAAGLAADHIAHLRDCHRGGLMITVVAESSDGVLAVGSYKPVGDTAEVLGVATLPCVRRRGLAAAVTTALVGHACQHGVRTVLLSAQNEDVARVYTRVGFHQVGTTCSASLPPD